MIIEILLISGGVWLGHKIGYWRGKGGKVTQKLLK
jgi:hypothetical protein